MHKEPRIPLSRAHLEKGSIDVSLIRTHKRKLVLSKTRQHPLLSHYWSYTGWFSCLHFTGREENSPEYTHT